MTLPVLAIERDDVRVEVPRKPCRLNGETAIHSPAAGTDVARELMLIHPDRPAGTGVESKGAIVLRGSVENSVDDEGVVSSFPVAPVWYTHFAVRLFAVATLI